MQLRVERAPPPDDCWDGPTAKQPAPLSEVMREYEAQRCHVCQGKCPLFGFGSPLTPTGKTLWSCLAHRSEVDRLVSDATLHPAEKKQPNLFDLERD